jgi:phosphate-selective porin OprO/OprP
MQSMKVGLKLQSIVTCSLLIRISRLKLDGFAYSIKLIYQVALGLSNRNRSGSSEYASDAARYILDAVLK